MIEKSQSLTAGAGFFKTLFDHSPYAMRIFSSDGLTVKNNDAWEVFWDVSRSDSVDRYNIFKDKQAQRVGLTSTFKQALAGISSSLRDVEYDPCLSGLAGRKRFLHVRMLPLEEVEGQVDGIVCILEDNTEQRLFEQERRRSQERLEEEVDVRTKHLEALLQFSTELSALGELKTIYEFVTLWTKSLLKFDISTLFVLSEKTKQLVMRETTGFPRSMVDSFSLLQDQGLPNLVARERKAAVVEDFQTESRFTVPYIIVEHELTSALAVPMLNKNELIGVLIGHTRAKRVFSDSDISLYQNIANQAAVAIVNTVNLESLQRSEERFRHLFESANDAIYLVDAETFRIVDCNQKALELDGYSRSEITAMKMFELYPEEEHELLDYRHEQVLRKGSYTTVASHHHVRKDSIRVPVEISSSLVEPGGRKLIMNIVRDVSSRKALEQEREETAAKLRRTNRMEALGLMAGGVAHDLNNILSGIISYPELMMMKLPEDSPVRADLQKVMESGQRAAGVVADLLTVARGAATVKEIVCLNELIQNYMTSPEFDELISLHAEVVFVPVLAADVQDILCSPVHMQKVIFNLVNNAAESIDGAGQVEIQTCMRSISQDSDQGPPPGEYTVLSVRDTGSGISRHDLEHIFDPFYTTKKMGRSGTGLGLAVVWNTIKDHDGYITVDSDERETAFTAYLPVSDHDKSCKKSNRDDSLADLHGKGTILVVDDEQIQREIVEKILTSLGYETIAVSSGEEAISFLEKNTVDLVLLDMLMEPGINGRQTYEQIIVTRPGQKAIVISGYSESEDIKQLVKLGVLGLLKKPYTMEEIGRTVQKALQRED
ncbi:MAG: PAS domain S-box protein [Thermodesulfobacteriota bacterium]|nr:PAS domain S-box protein [Thermodesulfobacteriota bacterium]